MIKSDTIKKFSIHHIYNVVYNFIRKAPLCTHEKWDIDTQIRTIKYRGCGKKAFIEEYKNLYPWK